MREGEAGGVALSLGADLGEEERRKRKRMQEEI